MDADDEGKKIKNELGKIQDLGKSVKCFLLQPTQDIIEAKKDGFVIPGILECNYPVSVWEDELANGKLEKRYNPSEILTQKKTNELIQSDITLSQDLENKPYRIKVENYIPKDRKVPLANKIAQLDNEECRVHLAFLEKTLKEVETFLFPQ